MLQLKSLGMFGSKNWGALYLQMQLKSKSSYNYPRALISMHSHL